MLLSQEELGGFLTVSAPEPDLLDGDTPDQQSLCDVTLEGPQMGLPPRCM